MTRPRLLPLALLLCVSLLAAACGGAEDGAAADADRAAATEATAAPTETADTEATATETTATETTATETTEATGAAGEEGDPAGAFPVEIEHVYGVTTIDAAPQRVVAWGWGAADAAVALGVVPVAVPFDAYAGDAEGRLPWTTEAIEAMGAELPAVLPQSAGEEIPFEAIAAAAPDAILAHYSGITESDYALLSEIAPTVAFPDAAWTTPWRDVIEIAGVALGRTEEADQVLADIDDTLAEAAEAHPELAGLTVANVVDAAGTFYVYKEADPRVEFMTDLGLEVAESVNALSQGDQTFFYTLSYEQLSELTSDVLVVYADTPEAVETFLTESPTADMAQVQSGAVAVVEGAPLVSSVSPPTALSLTWGLDAYLASLQEAACAAGAC